MAVESYIPMRAVIEGKIYNTATSKLIGGYSRPGSEDSVWKDNSYIGGGAVSESLWKTRKGAYYTARNTSHREDSGYSTLEQMAEDGSATRSQSESDLYYIPKSIQPISAEEALNWAEQHMKPQEIEAEFADTGLLEEA